MDYSYKLSLLIKIGKDRHIDQLQSKGLIFSKTVKYFREREIEEHELRRDKREGAQCSIRLKDLKISVEGKELPLKFINARLNTFDPQLDFSHIFCMYSVSPELADGQPFVDERNIEFGSSALLITNPLEFINRIENAIHKKYEFTYRPVSYYPDNSDYSHLTVFDKPEYFNFQREFRFHFNYID